MASKVKPLKINDDDEDVPIPREFSQTDYADLKGVSFEGSDNSLLDLSAGDYLQFKDARFTSSIPFKNIVQMNSSVYNSETSATTFTTAGKFIYLGTSAFGVAFTKLRIISLMSNSSTEGEVRLYDVTNNLQIGIITVTSTTSSILTAPSISNVPSSEAIFEIQFKRTVGSGTKKILLHAIQLGWD